jgi:hypothetical protein
MGLVLSFKPATASRATDRVNLRLSVPTEQTIDSLTAVAYVARGNVDVVLPEQMTAAERGHFAALLSNAVAHAILQDSISDLDPPY